MEVIYSSEMFDFFRTTRLHYPEKSELLEFQTQHIIFF
jgi:hypothetical protein